ncbi:MAG: T9SS type A sorting domain-containing protein [Bacteroidota bacterium]
MKATHLLAVVLLLSIALASLLPAQPVVQVAAGVDGISAALATATSGTIIELTTSGGEYIETLNDSIKVNITLRAASGLAQKPVIYGGGGDATFFVTHGSFVVEGVKFDGLAHGTPFGQYMITVKGDTLVPSPFVLKITNCEFAHWQQRAIYTPSSAKTALDTVLVKNCVFRNGIKQCMYLKATRNDSNLFPGGYKYCLVQNCLLVGTSSSSDGYFSYLEPGNRDVSDKGWPTVIVDHVTVDSSVYGIYTYTTPGAVIKNCIVTNIDTSKYAYGVESGRFTGSPASTVQNCLTFNLPHPYYPGNAFSTTNVVNLLSGDPLFNNPGALDYSLKAGSPGKNAGTDGKDLGYIAGGLTDVEKINDRLPESFQLSQNYPNPFNPTTTIQFSVVKTGVYSVKVFNLLGEEVASLFNGTVAPGDYSVHFDAAHLSSGMYVYTLAGEGVSISKKLVFLK